MIKKFSIVMITIFVLFAGLGCNGYDKNKRLIGEYTICSYGNYSKFLKERAQIFCENNPRVKIEIKDMDKESYLKEITNNINNGQVNYDGLTLKGYEILNLREKNKEVFSNLSELYNGDDNSIYGWRKSECKFDDGYYGYPLDTNPIIVYYNKDIFNKYGIDPQDIVTWNDYLNKGKEILEKSKGESNMLYVPEDKNRDFISTLMYQINIGQEANEEKKEKVRKITELIKTLGDEKLVTNKEDINNTATIISSPEFYIKIKDQYSGVNWDYMTLPAFEPGGNRFVNLEGVNFVSINNKKNNEPLKEFFKFCTNNKVVLLESMFKYGIFPANTQCYKHSIIENREELLGYRKLWQSFANITSSINKKQNFQENLTNKDENYKTLITLLEEEINKEST